MSIQIDTGDRPTTPESQPAPYPAVAAFPCPPGPIVTVRSTSTRRLACFATPKRVPTPCLGHAATPTVATGPNEQRFDDIRRAGRHLGRCRACDGASSETQLPDRYAAAIASRSSGGE